MKIPVNSTVCGEEFFKSLAGFGFWGASISELFFYKYPTNFPKLFLTKNVEKKAKAM
ncbi:MAG TPA: hypothetical protein VGQ09_10595 [Chitinophagaceae bacterium]|nr:hypothetical protein [Chitinophagaceae bacterium]